MSTKARRGQLRLLVTLVCALGALLAVGAGNAFAFGCAVSPDTVAGPNRVVISMNNETVTVSKGNLSRILINGLPCGANATTSNTQLIVVQGNGANDTLIIDEGGGRFEPGTPPEVSGLNEIEWLLTGTNTAAAGVDNNNGVESLVIDGNAAADTVNVGAGAVPTAQDAADITAGLAIPAALPAATPIGIVNLNGDDDADVYVNTAVTSLTTGVAGNTTANSIYPDSITVNGRGGNDTITGKGGSGTGASTTSRPNTTNGTTPQVLPPAAGGVFTISGLTLNGGEGDDSLQGGDGADLLIGGPGNDVIDGDDNVTAGTSVCFGVLDTATGEVDISLSSGDIVDYSGSTGPITADLDPNEGHPGSATGDGTDVLQNVEGIVGSPAGDTLSGDNGTNVLIGGGGDDKLAGDAGNDCEFGGAGNDTFDENEGTSKAQGGTGTDNGADLLLGNAGADDTVDYSSRATRVNVYLEQLPTTGQGQPGLSVCLNDNLPLGVSAGNVVFDGADLDGDGFSGDDEADCVFLDTENAIGGTNNDILDAAFVNNRSDNELTGNGGNDRMSGGAGNDVFHEGSAASGADVMDGGTGLDTCDYSARSNALDVSLDGADNDGEAGEGDNCGGVFNAGLAGEDEPSSPANVESVQGGSGNDVLNGNDNQNVLNGNAGNDTITGAGGQDVLNGGDGDDTLAGGTGNDAINGGNGTDTVDYASAGAGGVGVNVNLTTGQASGDGNDTLAGLENASGSSFSDSIRGDAGNNVLNGRGGADAIQGADGDDTINGGAGSDELGGGAGDDRANGGTGSDAVRGGSGDDHLSGGPGGDTLIGGAGNDVLSGGAGKDVMRGGPGTDRCNPGTPGLGHGDSAAGCER